MPDNTTFTYYQLMTIAVQVLTLFITFYLGRLSKTKDYALSIKTKRYNKAYVSFISLLYRGHLFDGFDTLTLENRAIILDLLTNNIQLYNAEITILYSKFYTAFLDMAEYEAGNKDEFPIAPKEFIDVANKITLAVLEEAQTLSAELKLPDITAPFLANYRLVCNRPQ